VRAFEYSRAADVEAAVAAGRDGATYLAGGTNLVDLMRLGVATPSRVVDVGRLGLDEVVAGDDGGVLIGAGVRMTDLAAHPLIRERYAVVSQALLAGASGQLRNMATIGGNLLQRTRCVYFQDVSKPCNKRAPGSGCPAIEGEHRGLAILGHSEACVATHPSDLAVALAALGAVVHLAGGKKVSMPGLHRLPGDDPSRDTVLEPGDLIVAVELPPLRLGAQRYRKVRDRASFAFALVSIAAAVDERDGMRLALGGVAHVPWRCFTAEDALRAGATFAEAADAELAHARPLRDNRFKVTLARNLLVRTLRDLTHT
jgi:xanthine dehydrogenase YagS FAD-binding subunit